MLAPPSEMPRSPTSFPTSAFNFSRFGSRIAVLHSLRTAPASFWWGPPSAQATPRYRGGRELQGGAGGVRTAAAGNVEHLQWEAQLLVDGGAMGSQPARGGRGFQRRAPHLEPELHLGVGNP